MHVQPLAQHMPGGVWVVPGNWGLSGRGGPLFPCRISGSPQPPRGTLVPALLAPSGGSAAGKPCLPEECWVRWENILYRSVAHATWSLAAETGWGETKLKSILCLINDCLYWESRRRTLGLVLSRRHIWTGMWWRCCGAFVVLASKEPRSCCCFPVLFTSRPSSSSKQRGGGGGSHAHGEVWCPSVHSRHPLGRLFLPHVWCLWSEHRCCAGASGSQRSRLCQPIQAPCQMSRMSWAWLSWICAWGGVCVAPALSGNGFLPLGRELNPAEAVGDAWSGRRFWGARGWVNRCGGITHDGFSVLSPCRRPWAGSPPGSGAGVAVLPRPSQQLRFKNASYL